MFIVSRKGAIKSTPLAYVKVVIKIENQYKAYNNYIGCIVIPHMYNIECEHNIKMVYIVTLCIYNAFGKLLK